MICFSLRFWVWCAFYNRPLQKHIILLSKCTSRQADKRIHIKLVSCVLLYPPRYKVTTEGVNGQLNLKGKKHPPPLFSLNKFFSLKIPAHCAPPNPPVLAHYSALYLILLGIQNHHWRGKWSIEFEREKAPPFSVKFFSLLLRYLPTVLHQTPCFGALSPFLLDPPQDTKSPLKG